MTPHCATVPPHSTGKQPQPPPLPARGLLFSATFAHPPLPWSLCGVSASVVFASALLSLGPPGRGVSRGESARRPTGASALLTPPPGRKHLSPSREPRDRADQENDEDEDEDEEDEDEEDEDEEKDDEEEDDE